MTTLCACAGGATPPVTSGGSGACTPVTITYWDAYSASSPEATTLEQTLIPNFEAANPCIIVQDSTVPYDDLHQKLITGSAGGTLPDIVRSDIIWVPELANLGVLEPLDQTMANFKDLSQQVFPGTLATNGWKGHYYGLPLDTNTLTMLYLPSNFTKWGLPVPTTWDQLKSEAPQLKTKGVYTYADTGFSGWNVLPLIWSFGGAMTDDAVTKATGYLNSPQSVAAIQWLYDMYKGGYIPTSMTSGGDNSKDFATGKTALIPGGPWMFPIFQGQYPDLDVTAEAIPSGPGGSISVVGGEDVVMTASSQHKDAAAKFITYMLSSEAQLAMAQVGQMSVLSSLSSQMTQIQPYYAQFVTQLATAKSRPATPAWSQVDTLLGNTLQQLMIKGGDVQQTMDSLAGQIDQLLAQYS